MIIFDSSRYSINYKSQFHSQTLEYGLIEIADNHSVRLNGMLAKILPNKGSDVQFALEYSISRKRPAGLFAKQFGKRNEILPIFAFNGGKSFDLPLLKSMGIDQDYNGCPEGLLIYDSRIAGIPIFGHYALLINHERNLCFKKISLDHGISLACNSRKVSIPAENRNLGPDYPNLPDFVYYDADYSHSHIPGNGRSVIKLGGATIREIYHTQPGIHIPYHSGGLALSIADEAFPPMWDMRDKDLEVVIPNLGEYVFGVGAGAAFVPQNDGSLKMEAHPKWLSLFCPDPDLPKAHLLCGTDKDQNILVVSLLNPKDGNKGLALSDLPEVLQSLGFTFAVSLEEGQGSSLYRGIERIHFSDNDADANFNPFSDAPQPGTASNAIIAY